ncbi:hypothetical protein [Sandarakinorhabdus sp.]|uniref:hypothetical protein n=1 Tax=Sandarakinorhabdus sp. TaxID=1916663 RepID=UPI00286DD8D0|nr:hypothetical protein [Sandarakinorhabdus sp.]
MDVMAAVSGLKIAYDMAKGLNAATTQVQITEVKIALLEHIMSAREALSSAQAAEAESARLIDELKQEIARLKDWSKEAQRYQLINVRNGAMAYAPKPGLENGEPAHWLCANCFS